MSAACDGRIAEVEQKCESLQTLNKDYLERISSLDATIEDLRKGN